MPLLALVTMAIITGVVGLAAGRMFGASGAGFNKCLQVTDPALGMHGRPNSTCVFSGHETDPVEYKFNNCGYRMDIDCGPPQPGTYRIVMIGSSIALGQGVPREKSIAALLQQDLSKGAGRKIEVYNESMMCEYPQVAAARFNEVLAAKPNMVLWVVSPFDIGIVTLDPKLTVDPDVAATQRPVRTGFMAKWKRWRVAYLQGTAGAMAREAWQKEVKKFLDSSTGVMLLHCLYQNQTRYVHSFLQGPDSDAGFLRAQLSGPWSKNVNEFNNVMAKIEVQAKAAGVPLVVVLAPARAQAAMLSMRQWPDAYDPYKVGAEVGRAVESRGETYIDILPGFGSIRNAGDFYLPVDGHPTKDGHSLLATLVAKGILGRDLLALQAHAQARRLSATGN